MPEHAQAHETVLEGKTIVILPKVCYVAQEAALELYTQFNCCVVFLGAELKEKYYKGGLLSCTLAVNLDVICTAAAVI